MKIYRDKFYSIDEVRELCNSCAELMKKKGLKSIKGELIIKALTNVEIEKQRKLEKDSGILDWIKSLIAEGKGVSVVRDWYEIKPILRALICDRVARLIVALHGAENPLEEVAIELVGMIKEDIDDTFTKEDSKIVIDKCFSEGWLDMDLLRGLSFWEEWKKKVPEKYW